MKNFMICTSAAALMSVAAISSAQFVAYENSELSGEQRLRSSSGLFDDVLIPVSRFAPGTTEVPVTSITFGMSLLNTPTNAGNFDIYWGAMGMGSLNGVSQPLPVGDRFLIGNTPDWAEDAPLDGLSLITVTGGGPLFTLTSDNIVSFGGNDYYAFVIGMVHNSARSGSGWWPALPNDPNLRFQDEGVEQGIFGWSNSGNTWTTSSSSSRQTFFTIVETSADPIPEPMTLAALALGAGLLATRRRRTN